jgi:hypothetical protein
MYVRRWSIICPSWWRRLLLVREWAQREAERPLPLPRLDQENCDLGTCSSKRVKHVSRSAWLEHRKRRVVANDAPTPCAKRHHSSPRCSRGNTDNTGPAIYACMNWELGFPTVTILSRIVVINASRRRREYSTRSGYHPLQDCAEAATDNRTSIYGNEGPRLPGPVDLKVAWRGSTQDGLDLGESLRSTDPFLVVRRVGIMKRSSAYVPRQSSQPALLGGRQSHPHVLLDCFRLPCAAQLPKMG